jgi:hypothetical protein
MQLIRSAKAGDNPLQMMVAICEKRERIEHDEQRRQRLQLPHDDQEVQQDSVIDFIYAMPRHQTSLGVFHDINPYDLVVVDQHQATTLHGSYDIHEKSRRVGSTKVRVTCPTHSYFYTVSMTGVTRQKVCDLLVVDEGGEEFTSLADWLDEKRKFDRLRKVTLSSHTYPPRPLTTLTHCPLHLG